MKGIIYPLTGLAVVLLVVAVIAGLVAAVNNWVDRRAHRNARWEVFEDIKNGNLVIGVQLVARWKNRKETLQRDGKTETVDPENFIARVEANTRAQGRADTYNNPYHPYHEGLT